jgi:hypothetical protein
MRVGASEVLSIALGGISNEILYFRLNNYFSWLGV